MALIVTPRERMAKLEGFSAFDDDYTSNVDAQMWFGVRICR